MPPATAALSLVLALVVGVVAELVSSLVRLATVSERPWWGSPLAFWRDLRRLADRRERASLVEAGGALAAFAGAGLATAAVLGAVGGSAPLLYLALLLGAAGTHVAASTPTTRAQDERLRLVRLAAAVAEPAFAASLGVAFIRWGAEGLEAVRGNQDVLGPGIALAPPANTAALGVAVLVLLVAGAARLVPAAEARRGPGRGAGSAVLATLARWAMLGATSLVAAVLVTGGEVPPRPGADLLVMAGGLLGCAVVLGVADGLFADRASGRILAVPALLVATAGALSLLIVG